MKRLESIRRVVGGVEVELVRWTEEPPQKAITLTCRGRTVLEVSEEVLAKRFWQAVANTEAAVARGDPMDCDEGCII